MTQRLIETWLPIAQLGIESLRERTPMTPYPAPNRLHVHDVRSHVLSSRAFLNHRFQTPQRQLEDLLVAV